MWIISVDTDYYPFILKFKTEEEAREVYNAKVKQNESDEAIFLSEVKEYKCGEDYEIEYGN